MDYETIAILPTLSFLFYKQNGITIPLADKGLKIELPNVIKIYGNKKTMRQIMHLINKFSFI